MVLKKLMENGRTHQGRYGQGYVEALEDVEKKFQERLESLKEKEDWALKNHFRNDAEHYRIRIYELRQMLGGL